MVTGGAAQPVLLSWSGSMFEYLLPMLIMPSYRATLLDATSPCRGENIRYAMPAAAERSLGDFRKLLQHFGGGDDYATCFRRAGAGPGAGPGEHLVIAPYAAALALVVVAPRSLREPGSAGAAGYLSSHGFQMRSTIRRSLAGRAVPRAPRAQGPCKIVMAHHSGMTLRRWPTCCSTGRCRSTT